MTMDTFYQCPVTTNEQGENANAILLSEKIKKLDALAEILKDLTIDDIGYYNSDENDAKGDPEIDPKVATHTT